MIELRGNPARMTARPGAKRKPPGRRRVSFRDDPRPWARLALSVRRVWQLPALFGSFAVGLLTLGGFDIADMVRYFTGSDADVSNPVLHGFTGLIWSFFGLLALAVALVTAFGKEEIRTGHGLMVHVSSVGPLRFFNEINIAHVRDVRTAGHGEQGDSRIYFDYGEHTLPFGSPQPGETADLGVEFIQRAIAARAGRATSTGGSTRAPRSADREAAGC